MGKDISQKPRRCKNHRSKNFRETITYEAISPKTNTKNDKERQRKARDLEIVALWKTNVTRIRKAKSCTRLS